MPSKGVALTPETRAILTSLGTAALVVGGYVVLSKWVLPRFGIRT